jgi:signal transduction histidine kinase/CheY-like chemotaxis protein
MGSAVVERARARAAAADEEQRFAVALESAAVPFSILEPVRDAAGRLIDMRWSYLNPAGASLFGRPAADLVGRQVTEILPRGWETPGLLERYTAVLDRDEAISFETPASPHNPGVWFQVIASPLQGSVAVWFADISERKRQEGLRDEADRRKDEFLATLAHELRNPLAPIRQGIRIARSASATDEQRRWSHDVIERQVKNMALLLDDLLDVSRISQGTLLLRRAAVALSSVVEAAVEVARPHIDAKGHRLEVNLPVAPVTLDVDLLRIAQVIGNLLTNAAKYTDPGGRLALQAGAEAGAFVIRVIDNGIGLAPDQTARLFEMFAQVPSAMGRSQGGLGIGLALSRRLVQLHGGDIEAASDGPGCGSAFTIRLPASAVISAPTPSTQPAASAPTAAHRILIADDNVDAADSLAELLRIDGHEVYVAYDGQQALAHFRRHEPDAVLLDIGMPKLTGLDVARAIRRLPAGRRTTLIAITGWGQSQDRLGAIEAGFDHHTTKPVDPALILGLIDAGRSPATFNRAAAPEEAPGG